MNTFSINNMDKLYVLKVVNGTKNTKLYCVSTPEDTVRVFYSEKSSVISEANLAAGEVPVDIIYSMGRNADFSFPMTNKQFKEIFGYYLKNYNVKKPKSWLPALISIIKNHYVTSNGNNCRVDENGISAFFDVLTETATKNSVSLKNLLTEIQTYCQPIDGYLKSHYKTK